MSEERVRAGAFAERLGEVFGEGLLSVVLYGSAARGEYRSGISDLNVLVIVRELGIDHLRRCAVLAGDWVAGGDPPPLLMSDEEWRSSADVFPIEYTDIRDAHLVLAGEPPFGGIEVRREHLRLQIEHELRAKKIQLREGYLVSGGSPAELGALLGRSLPTFLTLFRGMLRIDGRPVPARAEELVAAVAALVGFAAGPVLDVVRGRAVPGDFTAALDGATAAGYLAAVEQSVAWLDRYEPPAGVGDRI